MNLKDLHTENKEIQTQLLLKIEQGTVISLQIEAGKVLKEHISKIPATLICVTGTASYEEEHRKVDLASGDFVRIKSNVKHKVTAITESNFLLMR